ncbi:hypothetical protein JL721_4241 [Aureococcus anophagefferens]|nr:hypothetical protein JL721_4241 [Aureococcus anophagefferens]
MRGHEATRFYTSEARGKQLARSSDGPRAAAITPMLTPACLREGARVKSVGDRLEALEAAGGPTATEPGKYACAAVALLAALLRLEATTSPAPLRARRRGGLLERGGAGSLEAMAAGACGAWAQMTPLEGALKLVPSGAPSPDDVVVLVDEREGGGDAHHLPTIATFLKDEGVAYETRRLPTGFGDYAVARRRADLAGDRVDGVYPMLLERKSAVDVADSLRDGRWAKQHDAMRRTADRFPGGAALVYVVEGDPARHVHTACGCGCLGVGSCGNPNLAAVAAAVDARERSGVEIARTGDVRATARLVAALPRGAGGLLRRRARAAGVAADDARQAQARRDARVSAEAREADDGPVRGGRRGLDGAGPRGPRQAHGPPVLVDRKARKLYVPRDRSCPMALLCALDAAARTGAGPLSKDDWMARAERCGVASVSLYEKSGPMQYDGWSSCNGQLCSGQPSLVAKVNPGARYELGRLATAECASGRDVAAALHAKAHSGWCACASAPPAGDAAAAPVALGAAAARGRGSIAAFLAASGRLAPSPPPRAAPPGGRAAADAADASARTVSFGGLPPPPDDGVRERHSWRLGPKGSASVSMPALHSVGSSNADTLLSSSTTGSIRRRSKRDDDDGGAAGEPERRTIFFQRIPSEHGLDTGARVKRILLDLQHQRTGAPDEEQQRSPSSTLLYAQDLLVAALDAPRLATWIMASSGLWRFMGEWKRYAPVYEAFFLAGFGACGLACLGNAFLAATPYHTLPMSLLTAYVHVPAVHGFRFWRRTLNDVRSSGLVNSLVAHESSVVGAAVKNIGIGLRCTVVGQACFVVVVLAAYALPATPLGDFGATAPRTGAAGVDVAAVRAHGLLMWVFITMVMCAITGQYARSRCTPTSHHRRRGASVIAKMHRHYDTRDRRTFGSSELSAETFVVLNHVTLHTVGELKHTPYGYCYYFQDAFFVGSAGLVIFSTVVFAASVTSKCREVRGEAKRIAYANDAHVHAAALSQVLEDHLVGMSCFGHPVDQQKVAMILFATMLVLSVIAILARRYNVGSPRRALAP